MNVGPRPFGTETGFALRVTADGRPEYKAGGASIDWNTVTAVTGSPVTLPDGTTVAVGDKYLRYGTPITQILAPAEVQTIDLSPGADPDAGTWTITYEGRTTTPLAFNETAANVQAALDALDNVSVGAITVTKAGFVYTLTFDGQIGDAPQVTTTSSLTIAGVAGAIAVATGTPGNPSGGMFGPVDTTATDGRQTMAQGRTYVLNETVVQSEYMSDTAGGPFFGGQVYVKRLNVGGTNQPTLANLLAALPRLQPVYG
jgi:hypothetical protein